MSGAKRPLKCSPDNVKDYVFWIKWVPPCHCRFKVEHLDDYQPTELLRSQRVTDKLERIRRMTEMNTSLAVVSKPEPVQGKGGKLNPKVPRKSVRISECVTRFDTSDEDVEERGYRFVFHFSVKKYLVFLIFLVVFLFFCDGVISDTKPC